MELRPLGNTGILVSPIGLGTVKLGRNTGVKYPGGEGAPLPSDGQCGALLKRAAELGVNLIDTAPAYGTSEERLGELMGRNGWFGGRERWVISTKVGEEFDAATCESRFDFTEHGVRSSVHRSLLRLGVDRLDVVLIHSDGHDLERVKHSAGGAPATALAALLDLRAHGLVRAVGISTKTSHGTMAAIDAGCDAVMVTLNPKETEQVPSIKAAHAARVGVLVKKGLLSGHLGGVPEVFKDDPEAASDPAGASLRFILRVAGPGVSSIIVGTTSPEHLEQNVKAVGA